MAPRSISVHIVPESTKAKVVCEAFAYGVRKLGGFANVRGVKNQDIENYDAVALWGYTTPCQEIIRKAERLNIPWVFFDLGYWRRERHYYKVTVNDRHPTSYFQRQSKDASRWKPLKMHIQPWRDPNERDYILLAGMSGKAAWSWGLEAEAWELQTLNYLKTVTDRPIVYRPKPSYHDSTRLMGAGYDNRTPIYSLLQRAHCVVTHHSNVGCDALLAGVPVFARYGMAAPLGLGLHHLGTSIEDPYRPDTRDQWARDAAYCQWSLEEMRSGACLRHLLEEGLIK